MPGDSGKTCNLPSEKVFSIQIGSELFRLSGASIASDGGWISPLKLCDRKLIPPIAPSYFSHFFEKQLRLSDASNIRTLYIDRDPATFHEIARHLQGTHEYSRAPAETAD